MFSLFNNIKFLKSMNNNIKLDGSTVFNSQTGEFRTFLSNIADDELADITDIEFPDGFNALVNDANSSDDVEKMKRVAAILLSFAQFSLVDKSNVYGSKYFLIEAFDWLERIKAKGIYLESMYDKAKKIMIEINEISSVEDPEPDVTIAQETLINMPTMTMTTNAENVSIYMSMIQKHPNFQYDKTEVIIDWGDGKKEKVDVYENDNLNENITHSYSKASTYTITIIGENINSLICTENQLTKLDVSKNPELTKLSCRDNQLTRLDVSKNIAMVKLNCGENQLTSLDLNKNTELSVLACGVNQLTGLDVSKNIALTELWCDGNQLTKLDVSKNSALTGISCTFNELSSLDVSKNNALSWLSCGHNRLTSLDVSKNTALVDLGCGINSLTILDVSKNPALTGLACGANQLSSLDVSRNPALTQLNCAFNQLTKLDVSKNPALSKLNCSENQLKSLDISKNPALTELDYDEGSVKLIKKSASWWKIFS